MTELLWQTLFSNVIDECSIIRILQHLSKVIGEGFRDELRFAAANTGLKRGFESQEIREAPPTLKENPTPRLAASILYRVLSCLF